MCGRLIRELLANYEKKIQAARNIMRVTRHKMNVKNNAKI